MPGRNQSGERDIVGAITKAGDVGLRTALYLKPVMDGYPASSRSRLTRRQSGNSVQAPRV